ncbi:MAG: KamA family radical SAM protein [Treponema sp.]|jgi:lysine 2,3-aminomutase|nr:KamA family radical SAM protein [Treponema sp.]
MITSIDELPPALAASVSLEEKKYIAKIQGPSMLPFAVTPHFAALARPQQDDPIRRQFFPDPREEQIDPFALDDPLGESRYRAAPRLIHQYRDRALLLAGGSCAGYCRHCFRRVWLCATLPFISAEELKPALAYLAIHPEIREILVSGGDPLTADNDRLTELFRSLRQTRPGLLLRVCSRIPVTDPFRMDSETTTLLRQFRPLRLSVHINHSRELAEHSRAVLASCVDAGIPVHVQTVLLKGINDDPALLAELFHACLDTGLSPYYLFQLDLAPGTAHFRVPLKQGLAIYRKLRSLISGLGLPAYALDIPGGGGKIRLHDDIIAGEKMTTDGPVYILKDHNETAWEYPV